MTTGKRFGIAGLLFVVGLGISVMLQRGCGPSRFPGGAVGSKPLDQSALPQRIVTMAPSVVELLFALGAGDRVAAVGDWCFHPPEAKLLPRIGGEFNPSFERIVTQKPDLLIVQGKAEKLEAFCRQNGVHILHANTDTLATLRSGVRELGHAVGREAEADRLVARIDLELAAVASRVAGRPRPKVFLCMGHSPGTLRSLATAHGKSILSELLAIAGGQNVFSDIELSYPPVSKEDLLLRAPDVIFDLHPGELLSQAAQRQLVADWQAMDSLPAVRTGRIHVLTEDYLLVPGPRVPLVARRLAEALHPEAMGREVQ